MLSAKESIIMDLNRILHDQQLALMKEAGQITGRFNDVRELAFYASLLAHGALANCSEGAFLDARGPN